MRHRHLALAVVLPLLAGSAATASAQAHGASLKIPSYAGTLLAPGTADMYPVDVTANATDYLVMDAGRYRLVSVNRATGLIDNQVGGIQGTGPGQFGDARAVALDPSGNVYVADTPSNRIEKFDSSLNFITQWGSMGSGPGQFNQVYGVAVGMGLGSGGVAAEVVYAVDGAGRVEVFDLAGNYISQFNGGGILVQPRQVTVAPNTNVYVMNARKRECDVFDKHGAFLFKFGSNGTGNGQFSDDPRGIAVSADGTLAFATDSGGKRVEVFDAATGAYKYQVGGPTVFTNPRGLDTTSDNHLMVSDEWGFGLHEYSFTQTGATSTRDLFGHGPPIPGVNSPRGVRVAANGRIFVVDWWNQRVDSINADGSSPSAFGHRGTAGQNGAINFAWDAAIQPSTQRIFVANRESHQIEAFTSSGTYVAKWGVRGSADGQFTFPQGITFAPDGTLLVSDSGNGRIERFSVDANGNGTWMATYGHFGHSATPGALDVPTGISTAADGTIWVADTLNSSVQSMSPSGTWTRFKMVPGASPNRLHVPWGVTVAPDGSIWISDTGNDRIVALDSTGLNTIFALNGAALGAPGGVIHPFALAFGQANHVYLSDVWNNRVLDLTG